VDEGGKPSKTNHDQTHKKDGTNPPKEPAEFEKKALDHLDFTPARQTHILGKEEKDIAPKLVGGGRGK